MKRAVLVLLLFLIAGAGAYAYYARGRQDDKPTVIERQQGDIVQQEVQLENDRLNEARAQAQFEKGLVSAQQLETAQLQVKTGLAGIGSARKQLVPRSSRSRRRSTSRMSA